VHVRSVFCPKWESEGSAVSEEKNYDFTLSENEQKALTVIIRNVGALQKLLSPCMT
jgi:hypothetical protein